MKTRHNFNKDLRMDLACSRIDYFRPVFSYIHFKDGCAYACDTHILVKKQAIRMFHIHRGRDRKARWQVYRLKSL